MSTYCPKAYQADVPSPLRDTSATLAQSQESASAERLATIARVIIGPNDS